MAQTTTKGHRGINRCGIIASTTSLFRGCSVTRIFMFRVREKIEIARLQDCRIEAVTCKTICAIWRKDKGEGGKCLIR